MALLFQDSMDTYAAAADFLMRWDNSTAAYSANGGRYAGKAISLTAAASVGKILPVQTGTSSSDKFFASTAVKAGSFNTAVSIIQVGDTLTAAISAGAGIGLAFGFNASGQAQIQRGTTVLATGATVYSLNTWYRFEVCCWIDGTTGYGEIRIDGVTAVTFTGNTKNTTGAYVGAFGHYSGTSSGIVFDDTKAWNSVGSAPNDFLGDFRIDGFFVTGNGSTINASYVGTGVTSAYMAVDDPAMHTSDTDYLLEDTVGDINLFQVGDLASTPTSIIDVAVIVAARADNVGSRKIQAGLKSSTTTQWSGTDIVLPAQAAYVTRLQSFPVDPATSAAWAAAGFNALEVGYKVTG